jgi:hypothetical protein
VPRSPSSPSPPFCSSPRAGSWWRAGAVEPVGNSTRRDRGVSGRGAVWVCGRGGT